MSTDHAKVGRLFLDALDVPEDARAAWLDEACGGDAALRAEVASLLDHHDDEELVTPASQATTIPNLMAPGPQPPPLGDPEARYRRLTLLGEGGCGRVTRAWDHVLKRMVAHKQVRDDAPSLHAMLRQEARLLAWLDHPGALPVYDAVLHGRRSFYTTRLLEGETLRERLDREPQLPIREAIRILARVSETMANAHAKGVLHLDLKPANIMLLPYGQVCVLDWGTARFHDRAAYEAYVASGGDLADLDDGYQGIAGTPAYMPVEQAFGKDIAPAADIYAAGTVLYEMLTGDLPHAIPSPVAILRKATEQPTAPRTLRADLPEALETLCLRMIAPHAKDRLATFEDVLAGLDKLNHGAGHGEERVMADGEVLFEEGDEGLEAYQVLQGRVAIRVAGPDGPVELGQRGIGELIGEMAVVRGAPRSATVVAVGPVRLAVVTREVIEEALQASNPLVARMLRSLVDRLGEEADRARS